MMDRALWKAKTYEGDWFIGYYFRERCNLGIVHKLQGPDFDNNYDEWAVEYETLCQCSGLKDKNGQLIFEGDKVSVLFNGYSDNRDSFVFGDTEGYVYYIAGVWCVTGTIEIALRACYEIELTSKNIHD